MVLDVPATPHSSFSEPPLRLIALCATLTNAREKSCGIRRKKFSIWNTPFTNSYGIFKISVLRSMLLSEHIPTPICHHLFICSAPSADARYHPYTVSGQTRISNCYKNGKWKMENGKLRAGSARTRIYQSERSDPQFSIFNFQLSILKKEEFL